MTPTRPYSIGQPSDALHMRRIETADGARVLGRVQDSVEPGRYVAWVQTINGTVINFDPEQRGQGHTFPTVEAAARWVWLRNRPVVYTVRRWADEDSTRWVRVLKHTGDLECLHSDTREGWDCARRCADRYARHAAARA